MSQVARLKAQVSSHKSQDAGFKVAGRRVSSHKSQASGRRTEIEGRLKRKVNGKVVGRQSQDSGFYNL